METEIHMYKFTSSGMLNIKTVYDRPQRKNQVHIQAVILPWNYTSI